jgi:hypothetical protein
MKTSAAILATALALTVVLLLAPPAHAQGPKQSGVGPCRVGAQSLIAMLDDKDDTSADYRHVFEAVTRTCGPKLSGARPAAAPRAACRDLALKLHDTIEDGKLTTQAFARAREAFAAACAPK